MSIWTLIVLLEVPTYQGFILEPNLTKVTSDPITPGEPVVPRPFVSDSALSAASSFSGEWKEPTKITSHPCNTLHFAVPPCRARPCSGLGRPWWWGGRPAASGWCSCRPGSRRPCPQSGSGRRWQWFNEKRFGWSSFSSYVNSLARYLPWAHDGAPVDGVRVQKTHKLIGSPIRHSKPALFSSGDVDKWRRWNYRGFWPPPPCLHFGPT